MSARFDLSLYLITDRGFCAALGVREVVRRAVAGGATLVQLRDPHAKTGALVESARELVALLRPLGIPLIVNDRADVAFAARADGVHVGQEDMAPADARALLGSDAIVGLSITEPEQLRSSQLQHVDYLGVGPIFASATKPDAAAPIGLAGLAEVAARSTLPLAAIGGMDASNAADVFRAGARGIAVVSAICAAGDPERAARELIEAIRSV